MTGSEATRPNATHDESYWEIVWRQFRKNGPASVSLWLLIPLFLIAVFAPAIASNRPFIFFDGDAVHSPWLRYVFNPESPVDYLFNMAMLGFFPWIAVALISNSLWKRKGLPGRRRVWLAVLAYLGIIFALCVLFLIPHPSEDKDYLFRPDNRYRAIVFVQEEFEARQANPAQPERHGIYPLISFGPNETDTKSLNKPPGFRKPVEEMEDRNDADLHWLGTDGVGRDVLVRMIYGARISLSVGFVAVSIYLTIGVILGAIAGYFGGGVDMLISRAIEVMLLFPAFFLILTLVGLIGKSIYIIMVVIGLTGWPTIARLTRGEVLKQRAIDYVEAARALGVPSRRIIFRHILPNAISPALVAAPFGVAGAIVTESALSLLGFGVNPPTPTWGEILRGGNDNYTYWWLIVFPSLAIFFAVTVFNLVGSGLRDAMDPKLRA